MKISFLLIAILSAGSLGVSAQTPTLVSDINVGADDSDPGSFSTYAGKLYFRATTAATGRELHRYSGTGPAELVYDVNPGTPSGISGYEEWPVVELGGKLYFSGITAAAGTELMVYNGTGAPTLAGAEIYAGTDGSDPDYHTVLGGKIYFHAEDAATGIELWVHDPATSTNTRLTDLSAGPNDSYPEELTAFNGKLYFIADGDATGYELYCYDPSNNTTTLVSDINTGTDDSYPSDLMVVGSKMYFSAESATAGRELYAFDGSSVPVRVTDLAPGASDGVDSWGGGDKGIGAFGGRIYFGGRTSGAGGYQLYAYDPSSNTATLVYTLNPGGGGRPYGFMEYGGKLYFHAEDGTTGQELWTTTGTATTRVTDLNPGSASSGFDAMIVWNNRLYAQADNGTTGDELYSFADPAAITALSFDGEASIYPNPAGSTATLSLTLKHPATLAVALTDAAGRTVWASGIQSFPAGKNEVTLPMQNLPAGQYFYRTTDEAGRLLVSGAVTRQ